MPISHTCTQAGTLLQLLFTQMTEPHRRVYSLRQVSKLAHGTGQVEWLGSCTAACPPADADIVADLLCLLKRQMYVHTLGSSGGSDSSSSSGGGTTPLLSAQALSLPCTRCTRTCSASGSCAGSTCTAGRGRGSVVPAQPDPRSNPPRHQAREYTA